MKTKGYKTVLFLSAILVMSAIAPIAIADDTVVPSINFIDPTPADNAEVTVDSVVDNVSVSNVTTSEDVFYDQVWLEWDRTNYTMSHTMNTTDRVTEGSSTKYIFNYTVTNLTNGTYVYKVHANVIKVNPDNTTETFGVSETRRVTINITEGASFDLQLDDDWNLISIPLEIENTSINAVFSTANDGDELFAYDGSEWLKAKYYSGYGWDGALEIVGPDKGYWYSVTTAYTATIKGTEAGTRTVSIADGWNLIGYTRQTPANLSYLLANVTDEDELFAYDGSEWLKAKYYSGYGWDGLLGTMEPGKGYWYSANAPFIWEY